MIFERLDSFMNRLQILMDFFVTTVQFQKLERIEIGGLRGKALSHGVAKVLAEFKDLYAVFTIRTYDCLDPEESGFIEDYKEFNEGIISLDRKLAATLSRALEDCTMSSAIFKLLHVFGDVAKRKQISVELNKHIFKLMELIDQEFETFDQLMRVQKKMINDFGAPMVDRNMPKVTGQLNLNIEIRTQIVLTVTSLKDLDHQVREGKAAADLIDKAGVMRQELEKIEKETYSSWSRAVESNTAKALDHPLIKRDKKMQTIEVNFGKQIVEILAEVKVLKKDFPDKLIPKPAEDVFKKFDSFRRALKHCEICHERINQQMAGRTLPLRNKQRLFMINKH